MTADLNKLKFNEGQFHFDFSRQLVGALGTPEALSEVLSAALAAGVGTQDLLVLFGEAGERWLDAEGVRHGVVGRFVRWTQFLTDERAQWQVYEEHLAENDFVVAVRVARRHPAFAKVLAAFQRAGAQDLHYFGPIVTEDEA